MSKRGELFGELAQNNSSEDAVFQSQRVRRMLFPHRKIQLSCFEKLKSDILSF